MLTYYLARSLTCSYIYQDLDYLSTFLPARILTYPGLYLPFAIRLRSHPFAILLLSVMGCHHLVTSSYYLVHVFLSVCPSVYLSTSHINLARCSYLLYFTATGPYLPFLGPCLHETICLAQVVVYMGCCRRRTILHLSAPLASGRAKQGNQEESLNCHHQMLLKSPKCSYLDF